jgi:prepilin-type N-terminal cleavage/methylation domain-containing protein/prepilin-type processing-associated H-X9-DG protein
VWPLSLPDPGPPWPPSVARRPRCGLRDREKGKSRRGFTLIELLVVIAIIAVLAAMLLAALSRARAHADLAVCRGNLRQVLIGMTMYADETGGYPDRSWSFGLEIQPLVRAPWPQSNYGPTNSNPIYPAGLAFYQGPVNSVYACPGYNRIRGAFMTLYAGPTFNGAPTAPPSLLVNWAAYGYNDTGMVGYSGGLGAHGPNDDFSYGGQNVPCRPGEVVCPADMIAVGDAGLVPQSLNGGEYVPIGEPCLPAGVGVYHSCATATVLLPCDQGVVRDNAGRHLGRWNVGFVDAHVESLRFSALWTDGDPTIARRWNKDHQPHLDGS